jgi:hypothetical protein
LSSPAVTALVAKLQEEAELVAFCWDEFRRVIADVRDAHHAQLVSGYDALVSDAGVIGAFQRLKQGHLDWLVGRHRQTELSYPDLLYALGKLYPCGLPQHQPGNLGAALPGGRRARTRRADRGDGQPCR